MEEFIRLINGYTTLSEGAEAALRAALKQESYKKNEYLLKTGQICNRVWFIDQGMVRRGIYHGAKDITVWIYWESDMITALHSFTKKIPSVEFIQSLEDIRVFSISYDATERLFRDHPEIKEFSQLHQQEKLFCWDGFCQRFPLLNAHEKYEYLRQAAPEMLRRAKLGHIASLMRVSQETLSRIRAKKG